MDHKSSMKCKKFNWCRFIINVGQNSQLISFFGRMRRTKFWRQMSGLITNGMMSCWSGTRKILVELNTWGYLAIKSGFQMLFFTTGSLKDGNKQKSSFEKISRDIKMWSWNSPWETLLLFHKERISSQCLLFQCWRLFKAIVPKSRRGRS